MDFERPAGNSEAERAITDDAEDLFTGAAVGHRPKRSPDAAVPGRWRLAGKGQFYRSLCADFNAGAQKADMTFTVDTDRDLDRL